MKQGFHVCLYKRKGQPIITAYVKDDEAEISMSLDDFVSEMKKEVGSVTWTFRKATFEAQIDEAVAVVIRGIKKGATVIV
jgi:hypothetical protein